VKIGRSGSPRTAGVDSLAHRAKGNSEATCAKLVSHGSEQAFAPAEADTEWHDHPIFFAVLIAARLYP
jgi:hypothetical protein